jgi:hypothetical protein
MSRIHLLNQAGFWPWNVAVISGLFLLLSAVSCEDIPEYRVSSIEVFKYSEGDTLVYISEEENLHYIIVDQVKREFLDDSYTGTTAFRYEQQEVFLHFLHEEYLIEKHDSLYQLWQECYPVNGVASCDTLYDYRYYDRGIELFVTGEPVNTGRRSFKWKKLTFNDKNREFRHLPDFEMNGTSYEYVIKFVPDPETIDVTMPVRTIYFSYRHGILRYENEDAEVFEFLTVL